MEINMQEWRRVIIYGYAGVMLTGSVVILYLFNPEEASVYPPCPFHYITRLYCPGCGSLRALHNLLHGHLTKAMSLNPLMVATLPILGLMLLNPPWIYKRWVPRTALAVLVVYG